LGHNRESPCEYFGALPYCEITIAEVLVSFVLLGGTKGTEKGNW
jgi:hypothetical protein